MENSADITQTIIDTINKIIDKIPNYVIFFLLLTLIIDIVKYLAI